MSNIAQQLMALLDASPVNFLAAEYVENQLKAAGFTHLDAGKPCAKDLARQPQAWR